MEHIIDGLTFIYNTNSELKRARSLLTKEPGTIKWIDSLKGGVFYDIGANIGVYTLYAARRCDKVFSFEPHCGNFMSLLRNIRINNLNNCIPMSIALHNNTGFFNFSYHSDVTGTSASQLEKKTDSGLVELKHSWKIDDLMSSIPAPDYVKIDVDGNELLILNGMINALKKIKSIQIEVDLPTREMIIKFMSDNGFRLSLEHFTANGQLKIKSGSNPNKIAHNAIFDKLS
jgi:FkbM family methyltransferase